MSKIRLPSLAGSLALLFGTGFSPAWADCHKAGPASTTTKRHARNVKKVIHAQQLDLSDDQGRVRMRLSASSTTPQIELIDADGRTGLILTLDDAALPSVILHNPQGGSSARLAVDAKGAHVKFDHPGGGSSYLFLNNQGTSGIVLIDAAGVRRYTVSVDPKGGVTEIGGKGASQ